MPPPQAAISSPSNRNELLRLSASFRITSTLNTQPLPDPLHRAAPAVVLAVLAVQGAVFLGIVLTPRSGQGIQALAASAGMAIQRSCPGVEGGEGLALPALAARFD